MAPESAHVILITNDDGIESAGLAALQRTLADLGQVTVVAPREPMSAISHAISLYRPVRYEQVGAGRYAVDGTPVDCVILAVNHILPRQPSLVVSGINEGSNLGQNVFYSGTVAGAVEGTFHGIASVAISLHSKGEVLFEPAAMFMRSLAAFLLEQGLPAGVTLNVNVPNGNNHRGVRLTRRTHRQARRLVLEPTQSADGPGYWIRERIETEKLADDSDHAAIRNHFISVTPLSFDCPDAPALEALEQWIHGREWAKRHQYGVSGSGE